MKRILFAISIVFLGISTLRAQNLCEDQLKVAQRRFDDGLLDEIPQLLANCMEDGFTKEEKASAYKLLIQTYLFNEQTEKADEVMLKFLKEFPSYSLAANDPKEFINLYGTYRTKPIFKIEAKFGGSFCMPTSIESYGTSDIVNVKPTYKLKFGYSAEVNYINVLYKKFDYSIGVSYTLLSYGYTNNPYEYSTVTGTFKNSYIGLPIAVKYNYKFKGINLFAKAGVEPVYLITSSVDLERRDNIIGRQEPYTGTENLIDLHKKIDIRPLLAIGVSFKMGGGWLNVSAGVKFSTFVQNDSQKRYSNTTLMNKYFFVEDNLLLNQSNISVSYIRPIYKPKKIR